MTALNAMHTTDHDLAARRIDAIETGAFGVAFSTSSLPEQALILPVRPTTSAPVTCASAEPTRFDPGGLHLFVYRTLDIAISLAMIVLLLPVMILIMVAVTVTSAGPPIFAHRRIGQHGHTFDCYKFRSMYSGAEHHLARLLAEQPALRQEWQRDHKLTNDPRVTAFGHFLRVNSLDELPQLFNVLLGQMSLVGPRPVVEAELARYGRFSGSYLAVKPGLTGLWQVSGRSETSYRRRVATDHLYARKKSIMFDCRIMLATIPAVLLHKGAC